MAAKWWIKPSINNDGDDYDGDDGDGDSGGDDDKIQFVV